MRRVSPHKATQRAQMLERLLDTLRQAGAHGLTPIELAQATGMTRTSNLARAQANLAAQGCLYILSQHPVYILYHADVPREFAQGVLGARCAAEHALRAHKRSTTLAARKGTAPPPVVRRRTTLPAVDPKALRRDATVTTPAHVQVQVCPHGQDTRFRPAPDYRGQLRQMPLGQYPDEPASPWAAAAMQHPTATP